MHNNLNFIYPFILRPLSFVVLTSHVFSKKQPVGLKLRTKSLKPVQNQWLRSRLIFHSFHMLHGQPKSNRSDFPSFYQAPTHRFAQVVHKISPKPTDTNRYFSAKYTAPITTTTTFIYKNIEKRAI